MTTQRIFTVGQIEVPYMAQGAKLAIESQQMARDENRQRVFGLNMRLYGSNMVAQTEKGVADAFASFFSDKDREAALRRKKYGRVTRKGGKAYIKCANQNQVRAAEARIKKAKIEEDKFFNGEYDNTVSIGQVKLGTLVATGEQVSFASPFYKRQHKTKKAVKQAQPVRASVSKLIDTVFKTAAQTLIPIEVIGKQCKRTRCGYRLIGKSRVPFIVLAHMDGIRRQRELHPTNSSKLIQQLVRHRKLRHNITDKDIVRGWSGSILPKRIFTNGWFNHDEVVVRGRKQGVIVDARQKLSTESLLIIQQYSTPEAQFWNGFKRVFDQMTPRKEDHQCTVDRTSEVCGEIVAALVQSIHPCKKLSCNKCSKDITELTQEELSEFILTHSQQCSDVLQDILQKSSSASKSLKFLDTSHRINPNIEDSAEIGRLCQGVKANQMQQIERINRVLMKGSTVDAAESGRATKELLEICRWFNKHLSLLQAGSLSTFRNKASSKALLNPSLMCDNQLDKNGNFIWGERGYHSKRFFASFFDEVTPGDGYKRYIERTNPNGTRKLAIGNLIVPVNLERARLAMTGETVQRLPITESCVSRQNGSFVHVCCCVTTDDGKPVYSDVKRPTKRHLIIGSTGDPKLVDLPAADEEKMYIAKEGYCYLNIFLAMLLNVNENQAKEFTKMVRDVIVPMLNKWPSVTDVATACYILSVFFPETGGAELPRILVDHTTQTMHVIDSFGSLTTGYHVLKAGTAHQLIQFAANDLIGEMKHYRVGGELEHPRIRMERLLITSIYRPKRLTQLILEDPYILILSLVSPKLLITMYNSGSFEQAINMWVKKEHDLSVLFTLLNQLAKKVSMCELLMEQVSCIDNAAPQVLEYMGDLKGHTPAHKFVTDLLYIQAERRAADDELNNSGFVSFNTSLYETSEKIYCEELEQEWKGLSWWERYSFMKHSSQWRPRTVKPLPVRNTEDLEGKFALSVGWLRGRMKAHLRGAKRSFFNKIESTRAFIRKHTVDKAMYIITRSFKDIVYFINMMVVLSVLASIIHRINAIVQENRTAKQLVAQSENDKKIRQLEFIYNVVAATKQGGPTREEFMEHVTDVNPELADYAESAIYPEHDEVAEQSKTAHELGMEKIIAVMALLTMVFDTERSDAVFKVLGKVKTLFGTLGEEVRYQSLDDIQSIDEEKNLTVDFELDTEEQYKKVTMDVNFQQWWHNQMQQARTVPHYRQGGQFVEFTRQTAAAVCCDISCSNESEFLVRGAVGSGKSTGMPSYLSQKGRVLLIEPTRPLAENVCKQLRGEPFNKSPTLLMRGMSCFGSSNITIMTSGYALHSMANNPQKVRDYEFILFDECHTLDAQAMALYCLLKEYEFTGKILKVSATPPGKESEFKTQFDVKLHTEDAISFPHFVNAQGTKSALDVTQHGNNILVYVASYNEVDQLSKLLLDQKHMVTKVDGRTMKTGNVEIATKGSSDRKHFVVATNIIENGVTLDIDVVVDFGVKVVADLDTDTRCMRYKKVPISYGERVQRLGRVGRVKPGYALRIGHTEMGLTEIPVAIATEAAFLCFAYNLPVMVHNTTTSLLSKCTNKQAKTMLQFELSPFFMVELVSFNGSMHPQVHNLLKPYKLRDSEILLNTLAIPSSGLTKWKSVSEYRRHGVNVSAEDQTKLPFVSRDIPDKVYDKLWEVVRRNQKDAGFGRLSSASASKVAYTLSTRLDALPRTLAIIQALISEERAKKAHFQELSSNLCSQSFTLAGACQAIRNRYLKDHSEENLETLMRAEAQLKDFTTKSYDPTDTEALLGYGFLDTVQYESKSDVAKILKLKGRWNKSLVTKDVIVSACTFIGGCWMAWNYLSESRKDKVMYQGKRMQRLKFRDAHDKKMGRVVYGDEDTLEHVFGEAYTKKGKTKGSTKTKGMGKKTRNFVHIYGLDPAEYSFIRFVDPVTGVALTENPTCDISLVHDDLMKKREELFAMAEDMGDEQQIVKKIKANPAILAYYVKRNSDKAVRVDLTQHNPMLVCRSTATIAGFPEREGELRQTGQPKEVHINDVPAEQDEVTTEGKSMCRGLRNYNPISIAICQLTNESDGHRETLYGIGYGPMIITNSHLFKRNNGELLVRTHHGEFTIKNTTSLKVHNIKGKDQIIIRMPKDFPPFPMRLNFRAPVSEERACLVSSLFQSKNITSCVSESSLVMPANGSGYWKHWVSTKDGDCGLPMVSTKDGFIVGFHGLTSVRTERNYFIPFTDDFEETTLKKEHLLEWTTHWKHNSDLISWNGLKLVSDTPKPMFKITKLVTDLLEQEADEVKQQGRMERWVYNALSDNLKGVATSNSNLVTKHVIKGQCQFFQKYLSEHQEAAEYFGKYMGAYKPSRLNMEAYKKDFFKYSATINVGDVDFHCFEEAYQSVVGLMKDLGFDECNYITDSDEIYDSLNMKASVGALYTGKKQVYFDGLSQIEKDELLKQSCLRLFLGQMGVWNGSLKAELRPLEKITENKTRSFTAAPLDTLLGGKVCVDDFNNKFYSYNIKAPWTVGMTKFYGGWNELLTKLPNDWVYCDADGSQFDSSLTPFLLNSIIRMRLEFMEQWDCGETMLKNFYTEVIYTPILTPDGTIVKKYKGNPSGQPSTVVDNTLMVILTMYYSLKKHKWTDEDIQNRCVFFANGDDLLIAVDPTYESVLDSLKTSFFELGLKYNFDSRHKNKEDLWFMSHKGVKRDGMFIPKLEEERIVSILEWDRSAEISHRAEAICAAMIEAWGYPELLTEIRKFYQWLLEMDCFKPLVVEGKMPYIAEAALEKLYTNSDATEEALLRYWLSCVGEGDDLDDEVAFQAIEEPKDGEEKMDAGVSGSKKEKEKKERTTGRQEDEERQMIPKRDKDVDVGSSSMTVPRLNKISNKMRLPMVRQKVILNVEHLMGYKPDQTDLSNTRSTHKQFETWYDAIKHEYDMDDSKMAIVMNGLMVWCIENGTSPNINGVWVMMDGDEQVEFPLKPVVENAKPTLRQIMHHYSDAAEAYIELRNSEKPYMPRYGLQRNLRDMSLARYAFDFYEITSRTPVRAKEACMQMKAAALANSSSKMFGLDGNIATQSEDTERHTASDVNANMHTLLGVQQK